jgi:DNA-binding CsgD family transcriptional regulator
MGESEGASAAAPSLVPDPYGDPLLSIVVDLLPVGVVVLDPSSIPLFTNPAADRVVQKGDIFHLAANGALKLSDRSQRDQFEAFVSAMHGAKPLEDGSAPTARFFIGRPSKPPVSITSSICRRPDQPLGVVLFIRVPDLAAQVPTVSLHALFGLTPAEADLANALVAGESLAEYCQRRRISVNTGKTQLKAVLGKTGTRRQAQLVRVLAL